MGKKLTLEDCQRIAQSRGGKCLSTEYVNNRTKMKWKCSEGHVWESRFFHIKCRGDWCSICLGSKLTLKECQVVAQSRGGKCLSTKYINSNVKMEWQCNKGHEWESCFYSVKNLKTWCLICSGSAKLTIKDCQEWAKNKGGRCLSTKYINSNVKMKWQCSGGHEWESTFSSLKNGNTWCKVCSIGKTQKQLFDIIQTLFPNKKIKSNCRSLNWLKNPETGQNLEIDIWVPELKLAIEYDGAQHFRPVNFGGMSDKRANDELKKTQKRDQQKDKLIADHPDYINYFVRFKYDESIEEKYVNNKLNKILGGNVCQ